MFTVIKYRVASFKQNTDWSSRGAIDIAYFQPTLCSTHTNSTKCHRSMLVLNYKKIVTDLFPEARLHYLRLSLHWNVFRMERVEKNASATPTSTRSNPRQRRFQGARKSHEENKARYTPKYNNFMSSVHCIWVRRVTRSHLFDSFSVFRHQIPFWKVVYQ